MSIIVFSSTATPHAGFPMDMALFPMVLWPVSHPISQGGLWG